MERVRTLSNENDLLRKMNQTMLKLLEEMRNANDANNPWARRMSVTRELRGKGGLVGGMAGAGAVEGLLTDSGGEDGEDHIRHMEEERSATKGSQQFRKQLLDAFRDEIKLWPSTMVCILIFIISKIVDYLVGFGANYTATLAHNKSPGPTNG